MITTTSLIDYYLSSALFLFLIDPFRIFTRASDVRTLALEILLGVFLISFLVIVGAHLVVLRKKSRVPIFRVAPNITRWYFFFIFSTLVMNMITILAHEGKDIWSIIKVFSLMLYQKICFVRVVSSNQTSEHFNETS